LGKKREYKQGSLSQSGSADVVALISKTPCAIGYSGMGYKTDDVKILPISKKKGEKAIEPTLDTALDGTYPISRPLYLYTAGEPRGVVQEFVQWILAPAGQKIVEQTGYVPIGSTTDAPAGSEAARSEPATPSQPAADAPASETRPTETKPADAKAQPAAE